MEAVYRFGRAMSRFLDYVGAAMLILAVGSMAWAQEIAAGVTPVPGANVVLGWDFIVLTGLTFGIYWLARKLLPDDMEAKWLPVIMHTWSLVGTVVVAAIFHKLTGGWPMVGRICGQAFAQVLLTSGFYADMKKLSDFLPSKPQDGTTIGDLRQ